MPFWGEGTGEDVMTTLAPSLPSTTGDRATAPEQEQLLYRDGIVGLPGCFPASWADDLHTDFEAAFALARSYPEGTVGRGPHRYYFAVHPERIRGFVDLLTHPRITALCSQVLGTDYQVVELGFDVPLAGARNQPWHRDFRTPRLTADERRLNSLAFNVTTVDVTPDLAPFEILRAPTSTTAPASSTGCSRSCRTATAMTGWAAPLPQARRRVRAHGLDGAPRHREPLRGVEGRADPRRGERGRRRR